jgi:hypothetical protein
MRFKVTIANGRVFYVYAASQGAAITTFRRGCPGAFALAEISVEEDTGEWKTKLQEGPSASGRVVSAL